VNKIVVALLFLLLIPHVVLGQKVDITAMKDLFKTPKKQTFTTYVKKSSNELEFTAALLFLGYKEFFSSQDMQSCVFYPSCSVYAIESLGNDPFPLSVLKIFDRLTRCHPLASPKHYHIHDSGQLYDPVKP
jgi:putative component of membrane protein insertase Oxa1/YidC/SpoIIIJ protein YidD